MNNLYFKILDQENMARMIGMMTPKVFSGLTRGRVTAICDRPSEYYMYRQQELFRIGNARWETQDRAPDMTPHKIPRAYISDVVLSRSYQGQGLGQALMSFVVNDIKEQGFAVASLETRWNNARMQHIVEKMGFEKQPGHFPDELFYYEMMLR